MVSQQIPPGGAILQLDTHLLIIIFYTIKLNFKTIIYTVDPLGPHSTCWVDDIFIFIYLKAWLLLHAGGCKHNSYDKSIYSLY